MEEDSSTLAFSAASLTLCKAILSVEMSSPCCVVMEGDRGREGEREHGEGVMEERDRERDSSGTRGRLGIGGH